MSPGTSRVDDSRGDRQLRSVRLDRWLWAARFYKTRSLATVAVKGGKARLNDRRTKPGATLRIGDRVTVRKGAYQFDVEVTALSERRGPAREAVGLYAETPESVALRQQRRAEMKVVVVPAYEGKGRPTKKQRRELERLRRQRPDDLHKAP